MRPVFLAAFLGSPDLGGLRHRAERQVRKRL